MHFLPQFHCGNYQSLLLCCCYYVGLSVVAFGLYRCPSVLPGAVHDSPGACPVSSASTSHPRRAPQRVARLACARPVPFKGGGEAQNVSNWKTGVWICIRRPSVWGAAAVALMGAAGDRGYWHGTQQREDNSVPRMADILSTCSSVCLCFGNMHGKRPVPSFFDDVSQLLCTIHVSSTNKSTPIQYNKLHVKQFSASIRL